MTTIPELIGIYIRGLKQLFYYRPSKKGEKGKLSLIKIIILIAYIFAYVFAFLQFADTNITEAAIQEFRSDGDYIQINSNFSIEDNWTISLWIKIDSRGTGVFFSIPNSSEVPGVEYSVNSDKRFQIRNFNTANDGVVVTGIKTVQENRWYCVAGTYDGTQVTLYINGTEESSMNMTGATRANYNKTFIGSFSDSCSTGANATRGRIVEVRILDHALLAEKIAEDYNNSRKDGSFPKQTGTVAWYHLNDKMLATNIVKDSSPNGFDGINNGAKMVDRLNSSDIWPETLYFEPYNLDSFFPFSIYGQLAILMYFAILIGTIFFLLIGDRPLTIERIRGFQVKGFVNRVVKEVRDFASSSRYHTVITVGVLIAIIGTLIFLVDSTIKNINLYGFVYSLVVEVYWIGKAVAFSIWPMISPVLVFSAFLVSLDIFAKDYPKLMKGFTFRLVVLFIACLFVNLAVLSIISIFVPFGLGTPSEYSKPISVEGLEGVYFYEQGIWWAFLGIFSIVLIMLTLIAMEIIIGIRRGSNEIRDKRKANLLVIYPLIFVYIISKTLPFIITFGPRLRTLNNIIDLLSLLIIIFLGIFQVLGIQEDQQEQNLGGKDKLKKRLGVVPPYSKALFIFSLAFASFYISIEANLVLAIFEVQTISRFVKMLLSVLFTIVAICYVFWRYQPFGGTTSPGSNNRDNSNR